MTTTKEQELKALEKIEKIVSELGEDSYVGTAFEGCFDIARQNIENDWACSLKQFADSNANTVEKLQKLNENSIKAYNELKYEFDRETAILNGRIKELKEQCEKAEDARQKALDRAIDERRDLKIETNDDELVWYDRFENFKLIKAEAVGESFIRVERKDGWTQCFRIADIKNLEIL